MTDPTAATTFNLTVPAVQVGDYALIAACWNEETANGYNLTDASYTKLVDFPGLYGGFTLWIKEILAAVGSSSVTANPIVPGSSGRFVYTSQVVRGADPGLIAGFVGGAHSLTLDDTLGGNTFTFDSVNAPSVETLLLCFAATINHQSGTVFPTATHVPTGMIVRTEGGGGSSVAAGRYHGVFSQSITTVGAVGAKTMSKPTLGNKMGGLIAFPFGAGVSYPTTELLPDGVAAQSGYANATTGNIANLHGDPDVSGGTGFTAS
jgi:hypothetical protein